MAVRPAKCPKCDNLLEVDGKNRVTQCIHCRRTFFTSAAIDYFAKTYNYEEIKKENTVSKPEDFEIQDGVVRGYHGDSFEAVIPEGVTGTAKRCFKNAAVTKITLPGSMKSFVEGFSSSQNLRVVCLSEGITEVSREAFCCCRALEKADLPSTLKVIGDYAFAACNFTEIEIPEGVEEIGDKAFASCSSLKKIGLPSTLKKIGRSAFSGCAFAELTIPESVEEIGERAFGSCKALEEINILAKNVKIGEQAFRSYWRRKGLCPKCGSDSQSCGCTALIERE